MAGKLRRARRSGVERLAERGGVARRSARERAELPDGLVELGRSAVEGVEVLREPRVLVRDAVVPDVALARGLLLDQIERGVHAVRERAAALHVA